MENKIRLPYGILESRLLLIAVCLSAATCLAAPETAPFAHPRSINPALAPISDAPGLPRVLLIGDSISIGYTLPVREQLKGVANVHRPPTNCGDTAKGLAQMDAWLASGKWDVIHFNFGLHDIKFLDKDGKGALPPAGVQVSSQEGYAKKLTSIVSRLKSTGATLIFATTTPVPAAAAGRRTGDVMQFNETAMKIMRSHGVFVNDLYLLAVTHQNEIQKKRDVHFAKSGYQMLAEQVAAEIKTALLRPRGATSQPPQIPPPPPAPVRCAIYEKRMQWWREARFGCFVHWNPSTVLGNMWHGQQGGGYSEHIQRVCKISMADYKREVVGKFNPIGFNAEEWMSLAKRAGMEYFIITAKHHDGFALYDSKASDYNVVKSTPWGHDPMPELKAAAKRHGIYFGFYYSHAFDWGDPDGPGNDWEWRNPGGDLFLGGIEWWLNNPAKLAEVSSKYVDRKSIPQIRELISNYKPDIMWFDTPSKLPFWENYRILQATRQAGGENLVLNGRLARQGNINYGDYLNTGDRAVEFVDRTEDWEAIPTTNESYGWNPLDTNYKTPEFLTVVLAKAVARGGNILLNIGPMADGRVDPRDVAILEGIGRWMESNSDSIRGCGRAALPVQPWGVITRKKNMLYLHIFDWPKAKNLIIGGLYNTPYKAWILSERSQRNLPICRLNAQDIEILLPERPSGAAHPVIALEFSEAPNGGGTRLVTNTSPVNQLLTYDAEQHRDDGSDTPARFGFGDGKVNRFYVTGWIDTAQRLSWKVRLNEPTRFNVVISYAKGSGDGVYEVRCGDWSAQRLVSNKAVADKTHQDSLGTINLSAGEHVIELRATRIRDGELFRPLDLQLLSGSTAQAGQNAVHIEADLEPL